MALILCLETATAVCSVSLVRDGLVIGSRESTETNIHSTLLTSFMEELMGNAGIDFTTLDAIAVSSGPGSYTGLRIGVAAAKGLCYATDKPLIAIPTLRSMAYGMVRTIQVKPAGNLLLCPMIDARRMEVYCGIFDEKAHDVREVRAEIVDENSFHEELTSGHIVFGGDGTEKCRQVLSHQSNAIFLPGFKASAVHMAILAEEQYSQKLFEDLAYFEPFYLKDFVAGKPHVKGLR